MKKSIGAQTILHPHPVLVVATYNEDGSGNMATVSWAGICCSRPPCVAISLRAATKTHKNLAARQAFTVNIPSERYVAEADFVGIVSGWQEDKFARTGLTLVRSEEVDAPYIAEFPVSLECKVVNTAKLGLHTQFVGEIMDVKAHEEVLGEGGLPDIEKVRPIIYATGNSAYYAVGKGLGPAFSHKEFGK